MSINYLELLKKAEDGKLDFLSFVLRHKLGKEYPIDSLEGLYIETSIMAHKRKVPLRAMKYTFEGGETTLKDKNMPMDLYLKRLKILDDDVKPRYIHLGEFSLGKIAENIEKFKKIASDSKNALYIKLQDLKTDEKIEEYLDELERVNELRDMANCLFGKPGS